MRRRRRETEIIQIIAIRPQGDSTYTPVLRGNDMAEFRLIKEIIKRSVAKTWEDARREWILDTINFALCGHLRIKEICTIQNRTSGASVGVGNCCVKKLLGLPSDKIFQAIKRIRSDPTKSLNAEAIEYAHGHGWINDWERTFCLDNLRKPRISPRQRAKREQINAKLLFRFRLPARAGAV